MLKVSSFFFKPHTTLIDIYHFEEPVVWVGDVGNLQYNRNISWCEAYGEYVHKAQQERKAQNMSNINWPIYIVDWRDFSRQQPCPTIENLVGKHNVYYFRRSIVTGRKWDDETKWVIHGTKVNKTTNEGRTFHHIPLTVRTDTVEGIDHIVHKSGMTSAYPIEQMPRSFDVISLWPHPNSKDAKAMVGQDSSNLRFQVSRLVDQICYQNKRQCFVGIMGSHSQDGRWFQRLEYLELLLNTKIIVVVNRDWWEDQYRLMEALVSGALVFTDTMVSLPHGLQNGTSIIEFASPRELNYYLLYYLQHTQERLKIATEGRRIAMTQHRTWHRMEEIIFGKIKTTCDHPLTDHNNCPYTVHATLQNSVPTNCTERIHVQPYGAMLDCSSWHLQPK